jgi:hypothetical protein
MSSTTSSPRSGRKRANDEIYKASTGATPSHSKKLSFNQRPRTASEHVQKHLQPSQFEQHGFPKDTAGPAAQSFESTVATLNTQPSDVSTAATAVDAPQTFVGRLRALQAQLDFEYCQHERDLGERDRKAQITRYDWDDLERRYLQEMEPAIKSEQEIQTSLAERYGVGIFESELLCLLTMDRACSSGCRLPAIAKHTGLLRGKVLVPQALCYADRICRLRTRVAFVQNSEAKLADKEQHCECLSALFVVPY